MKALSSASLPIAVLIGLCSALVFASRQLPPSLNIPTPTVNPGEKQFWHKVPVELIADLPRLKFGPKLGSGSFGLVNKAIDTWTTIQPDGTKVEQQVTVAAKCATKASPKKYMKGSREQHTHSIAEEFVVHLAATKASTDVLPVHNFFADKQSNRKCFTMDLAPVGDAHAMLTAANRGMPESLTKTVVFRMARALYDLSKAKIFHRDIKPNNIVFLSTLAAKLADFGMGIFSDERSPDNRRDMGKGNRVWGAPEIRNSQFEISAESLELTDVYSLGKVMQNLLTAADPTESLAGKRISVQARDLIKCMTSDQSIRYTAKKVLDHPWLVNAKTHIKHDDANAFEELKAVVKDDGANMADVEKWLTSAGFYKKVSM